MKLYTYKAKNINGKILTGTKRAVNKADIADFLVKQGFFVTKIKEISNFNLFALTNNNKFLILMCKQLAVLIKAGIPLLKCFDIIIKQTTQKKYVNALQTAYFHLQQGQALAEALKQNSEIFPGIMIYMIAAGEKSGNLEVNLLYLVQYFEGKNNIVRKLQAAALYPALVLFLSFICIIFIFTVVLPSFIQLFNDLNVEIPVITAIMFSVSKIIIEYWLIIIILLISLSLLVFYYLIQNRYRRRLLNLLLKTPVLSSFFKSIAAVIFFRNLAILINSGIPILSALDIIENIIINFTGTSLKECIENIKKGTALSYGLSKSGLFSQMTLEMINVGEESGQLVYVCNEIADFYEKQLEEAINNMSKLIEPILIIFVGSIVGSVVLGVILPLLNSISNILN